MGFTYAVIGTGRQGISAAYDLLKHGNADELLLIDNNQQRISAAHEKLTRLTKSSNILTYNLDIKETEKLKELFTRCDAVISGLPYLHNPEITRLAIECKCNYVDFGGNTDLVKEQLKLDEKASDAGISIVPDCGMDPGLNISLIMYIFNLFDEVVSIKSYGAGLTQFPKPPWNFELTFNMNGLTNEYYGNALYIRDGKVEEIPCLTENEMIDFPDSLGQLEAAVTSGGLSTLPHTLEGKIRSLENKTLRYPGHWQQFKAFSDLGLFNTEPIDVNGINVVPRDIYHKLIEPQITAATIKDIGIIKIFAEGVKNGRDSAYILELIDYYDPETGFTAMQRLTGWHASLMAILANQGKVMKGAISVENAVHGREIKLGMEKRGIKIKEEFK